MRHKFYKNVITAIAFCFLGTALAQKVEKKFTENFKVNQDIEVAINATNTEINVITWNKNEVQIDAFIEIEGMSKEDAEKYIKNWNFEALGNKKKVQITSKGNNSFGLKNDVVFFNNMDFNFEIPEIQIPNFDSIVIPDMDFDFDFDFDFETLEEIEENMEKKGEYSFEFHNGDDHIVIKTKEEWEKFKKSKKYDELKETFKNTGSKLKIALQNSKKEMKAFNKEQLKASINQAKLQIKNIDVKELQKSLQKAQETLKNMSFNFSGKSNDLTIDGKKIKIKKRLEIKVPKSATFDLNTRHCKVKLPNTVAFGNVKYGTFDVNNLNGGNLTVDYSKVNINDLNACTLFLNNVTDAKIASVTNTTMSSNSSGVKIYRINENVTLSDKFGELTIDSFSPNFGEFVLNLSQSEATIILDDVKTSFKYNINNSKLDIKSSGDFLNKVIKNYKISSKSEITNSKTNNKFILNSDYSSVIIK
jgi:hypothetical protein